MPNFRIHCTSVWLSSTAMRSRNLETTNISIEPKNEWVSEPSHGEIHLMHGLIFLKRGILGAAFSACAWMATVANAGVTAIEPSLTGTWTLVAADVQRPDGSRARDYGAAPKGLLFIDAQGHYSLQIFKAERPQFVSGDKSTGTPTEYQAAVMGSSTHFGTVSVDPVGAILTFHVQNASFPNWEGEVQKRSYELKGNELSYRVAPRPNGDVPISIWQRLN
jgi:Lipocalin-like domain